MSTSPTQLSLDFMRKQGYHCAITEHWNHFAHIRQDLFGFIDILALADGGVIGIQTTSYSNLSARVKKITDHDNVGVVRKSGIQILVHGWRKVEGRWQVKIVDLS
jgi:hypothetical protein